MCMTIRLSVWLSVCLDVVSAPAAVVVGVVVVVVAVVVVARVRVWWSVSLLGNFETVCRTLVVKLAVVVVLSSGLCRVFAPWKLKLSTLCW